MRMRVYCGHWISTQYTTSPDAADVAAEAVDDAGEVQDGDDAEAEGNPPPEAARAEAAAEREQAADGQAEQAVADEGIRCRQGSVGGAAKDAGADHLDAVEDLEDRGDRQQPRGSGDHRRIGAEQRRELAGREGEGRREQAH